MRHSGIRLDAMPPKMRAQIEAQLGNKALDGALIAPAVVSEAADAVRLRQSTKGLNKTEAAFQDHLKAQYPKEEIHAQSVTFKIGNGVRYTPDFVTFVRWEDQEADECHCSAYEVKGFMRDDAAVKIKVAAHAYPRVAFFLVTKRKAAAGGGWSIQRIWP